MRNDSAKTPKKNFPFSAKRLPQHSPEQEERGQKNVLKKSTLTIVMLNCPSCPHYDPISRGTELLFLCHLPTEQPLGHDPVDATGMG